MTTASMHRLRQQQIFLKILVFSFFVVLIWIGVSVFQSQKKTALPSELVQMSTPLNPNIDLDAVSRIEQKRVYTASDLAQFSVIKLIKNANGQDQLSVSSASSPSAATATPHP